MSDPITVVSYDPAWPDRHSPARELPVHAAIGT
jgi:hypothetical protein